MHACDFLTCKQRVRLPCGPGWGLQHMQRLQHMHGKPRQRKSKQHLLKTCDPLKVHLLVECVQDTLKAV